MGVVYLARDAAGNEVALKLIRDELAADPAFRARFAREVRAGQRVGGMCTARYVDADLDSLHPYLVTEYVAGGNLADFVAAQGPLEGERLVGLAVGLAEGLVAMGAAGVIHRDLKPSNVLMGERGPKLADFGISVAADGTSLTQTGAVMGSPSWMAPEQAQGQGCTSAADVFSWGATVAFAATGRQPFGEGRPEAVLYRVVHEEPDLEGVDRRLAPLIRAALSKDPARRPSTDSLLVDVIKSSMPGEPQPVNAVDEATEVVERTWIQPPAPKAVPSRLRQLALVAAAVVVIGAFVAGALYVAHGDNKVPTHGALAATGHHNQTHPPTIAKATTTSTSDHVSTTTSPVDQSPTQTVSTSLPVVACPTSYAITPTPAAKVQPSTLNVSVPRDLVSQLSVYADEAGVMDVLGPSGWNCTASFGADGSGGVTVVPVGEVLPQESTSLPSGSTDEAILATQNGGCQGCASDQACPFFAAAAQANPSPCNSSPPSEESVDDLASNVVAFADPPNFAGDADPSGGEYPANAVMTYTQNPQGSVGNVVDSWFETCTLPDSQQALCTAVLNDFVARYKNS